MSKKENDATIDKSEITLKHETKNDLIDPDPFSIFLVTLSILGNVATIASWLGVSPRNIKNKNNYNENHEKSRDLEGSARNLRIVETDLFRINECLSKMQDLIKYSMSYDNDSEGYELRFGTYNPFFNKEDYEKYIEYYLEMSRLSIITANDLSRLFIDYKAPDITGIYGQIDNDEVKYIFNDIKTVEYDFKDLRESLNSMLTKDDLKYSNAFKVYSEKINRTISIVKRLSDDLNRLSRLIG